MCRRPAWYTPVRTRILDKVGQKGADGTAGQRSQSRKPAGAAEARSKRQALLAQRGLHVGYRKGKRGGVWVTRRYLGGQSYSISTIAQADDVEDANGKDILDFWQAQEVARNLRPSAVRSGPYTVRNAVDAYLDHLEGRPSWRDTKKRLEAFALPVFGDRVVNELDEDEIRRWHVCATLLIASHEPAFANVARDKSGFGMKR